MNHCLRCAAEPCVKESGHHPARRLALQRVIPDRAGGSQRAVDITGFA